MDAPRESVGAHPRTCRAGRPSPSRVVRSAIMPFGTWNEVGLVAFLAFLIVVGTKIGTIGGALGSLFAKKR